MAVLLSTAYPSSTTAELKFNFSFRSNVEANPLSRFQVATELNLGKKKNGFIALCAKGSEAIAHESEEKTEKVLRKRDKGLILSEGRDEDEKYGHICPGCGVFMQEKDPNIPGYYMKKAEVTKLEDEVEFAEDFVDEEIDEELEEDDESEDEDDIEGKMEEKDKADSGWDSDDWESKFEDDDDDDDCLKGLDGYAPAGVGYGNITEEYLEKMKKKKVSKAEKKKMAREEAQQEKEEVTVCARCHSLRNYGKVKNKTAENLIPDFDFDRLISTRLMKPTGKADATVVVMVVDCVDFDGSFPKRAAKSLFKALEVTKEGLKHSKRLPKLVLVATKVDLLPPQVAPARLDKWVRHRAKANGAPKLSGVYLVSAHKDLGVRNLLKFIKDLAGPRGNIWVIGAQNAGKSTLINAFAKKEGVKVTKLTEAAVPGTTLGILRIGGILPAKAKLYDTPGLLHPYLLSMRLNRDEQKMIELRKQLQPRTFRIMAGHTIHVGGLARLDLIETSVPTIYVTIWASPNVSLHLGKIEDADEIMSKHVGIRLQPPLSVDRVSELGEWRKKEINVSGLCWDMNSIDVAVSGFGWFSLGLKGKAKLILWMYDGVEITLREPLVLDRARIVSRPGFLLPKAISDAIGKVEAEVKRKPKKESDFLLSEV